MAVKSPSRDILEILEEHPHEREKIKELLSGDHPDEYQQALHILSSLNVYVPGLSGRGLARMLGIKTTSENNTERDDATHQHTPHSNHQHDERGDSAMEKIQQRKEFDVKQNEPITPEDQQRYSELKKKPGFQRTQEEDLEIKNIEKRLMKNEKAPERPFEAKIGSFTITPLTNEEKPLITLSKPTFNREKLTDVKERALGLKDKIADRTLWYQSKLLDEKGNEIHVSYQFKPDQPALSVSMSDLRRIDPERYREEFINYYKSNSRIFQKIEKTKDFLTDEDKRKEMLYGNIHIVDKAGNPYKVEVDELGNALTPEETERLKLIRSKHPYKRTQAEMAQLRELERKEKRIVTRKKMVDLDSFRSKDPKFYRQKLREYARESNPLFQWRKQFGDVQKQLQNPTGRNELLRSWLGGDVMIETAGGSVSMRNLKRDNPQLYARWMREMKTHEPIYQFYRKVRVLKNRPQLIGEYLKSFGGTISVSENRPENLRAFGKNLQNYYTNQTLDRLPNGLGDIIRQRQPRQTSSPRPQIPRREPSISFVPTQQNTPQKKKKKQNLSPFLLRFGLPIMIFLIMVFTFIVGLASLAGTFTPQISNGPAKQQGSGTTPNSNTCAGKLPNNPYFQSYTYEMSLNPKNQNFGDPNCDFTFTGLANTIKQFEPNADRQKCWYDIIARWEGVYNANAYNGNSTSGLGAYGIFQMNPSSAGRQSTFDVGNVYWQTQTENAIKHNILAGNLFNYWDPRTLAHDPNRLLCHS